MNPEKKGKRKQVKVKHMHAHMTELKNTKQKTNQPRSPKH